MPLAWRLFQVNCRYPNCVCVKFIFIAQQVLNKYVLWIEICLLFFDSLAHRKKRTKGKCQRSNISAMYFCAAVAEFVSVFRNARVIFKWIYSMLPLFIVHKPTVACVNMPRAFWFVMIKLQSIGEMKFVLPAMMVLKRKFPMITMHRWIVSVKFFIQTWWNRWNMNVNVLGFQRKPLESNFSFSVTWNCILTSLSIFSPRK